MAETSEQKQAEELANAGGTPEQDASEKASAETVTLAETAPSEDAPASVEPAAADNSQAIDQARAPRAEKPKRPPRPEIPRASAEEVVRGQLPESQPMAAEYLAVINRFSTLVRTSGLGQTLALLRTQATPQSELFVRHLSAWAMRGRKHPQSDLLDALVRRTSSFQEEVLAELPVWLAETERALKKNSESM